MNEQELESRLKAIENNVNNNTAIALALTAVLSALPEAAQLDWSKAMVLLNGLATSQPALASLIPAAQAHIAVIQSNAREALRH